MPQDEANTKAKQAALKALELDETLPEAHAMMGVLRADDYDWQGAEREFCRALELDPKSEDAGLYRSLFYLVPMRRFEEAIAASMRLIEIDPLSPFLQYQLGLYYSYVKQFDGAIVQYRNALELDPHYMYAHTFLGMAYIETGKFDEGIRTLEAAVKVGDYGTFMGGILGCCYARAGRKNDSLRLLDQVLALAQNSYVQPLALALLYAGAGDADSAFNWLDKAAEKHDSSLVPFVRGIYLDELRSHPRFYALMRKINLEP